MPDIWLSSDYHLNHDKPFIYEDRGFASIEDMNKTILEKHNDLASNDDIVYILGDVVMGDNYDITLDIVDKLKGKKYLAIGNHDTNKRIELFKKYNLFEDIQIGYRLKIKKYSFMLSHYPMLVSNMTKDKIWSIHGHTHSKDMFGDTPHCINVAVDAWNCCPVNIDRIINYIVKLER